MGVILRKRVDKINEQLFKLYEKLANESDVINEFIDIFYKHNKDAVKKCIEQMLNIRNELIGAKIKYNVELIKNNKKLASYYSGNNVKAIGFIGEQLINRLFQHNGLNNNEHNNIKTGKFSDFVANSGLHVDYKFIVNGNANSSLGSLIDAEKGTKQELSIIQEFKNYANGLRNDNQIKHLKTLLFIVSYKTDNNEIVISDVEIIPLILAFTYKDGKFSNKGKKTQQLAARNAHRIQTYTNGMIQSLLDKISTELTDKNKKNNNNNDK